MGTEVVKVFRRHIAYVLSQCRVEVPARPNHPKVDQSLPRIARAFFNGHFKTELFTFDKN
jgi:hypothetical protein